MPTPTYVALAKTVLTTDTASVTFSAIPSTYTDLLVVCQIRGNSTYSTNNGDYMFVRPNGSTSTSVYSVRYLQGAGSYGAGSGARSTANADSGLYTYGAVNDFNSTANTFSNIEIYIPNYAGSTNKVISSTGVTENNNAGDYCKIVCDAGLFSNTAAITSLDFIYTFNASSRFVSGSRFDLYGIKNS